MISYEEFRKLDLRIGKVIQANQIPGRTKILELKVDLGGRVVSIVVGGAEYYPPSYFLGKKLVVVANLEPKKIASVESRGMVLAADHRGKPIWLIPEDESVPEGTPIR